MRTNIKFKSFVSVTRKMKKCTARQLKRCASTTGKSAETDYNISMNTDDIAKLIAPLHAASWKSAYRGILSDHYLDYVVDGERLSHWVQHVQGLVAGDGEIFLARLEDEAVGFLCIESTGMEGAADENTHGAYVSNLHVLPHIKGQGIGTALLEVGAKWANARGFTQMYLFVFEDNAAGRTFYQANGWHVVERIMSELPDGALAAELRLVKQV